MTLLNISRAVTAVVVKIYSDGGATESLIAGVETPTSGYAVSIPGREVVIPGREVVNHLSLDHTLLAITEAVERYAARNRSWLAQPGYFLGAWLDGNRLVLDVTQVTPELGQAVAAGVERKQDAIYNLADGAELWLKRKALPWVTEEQGRVWELLDAIEIPFEVVAETFADAILSTDFGAPAAPVERDHDAERS